MALLLTLRACAKTYMNYNKKDVQAAAAAGAVSPRLRTTPSLRCAPLARPHAGPYLT